MFILGFSLWGKLRLSQRPNCTFLQILEPSELTVWSIVKSKEKCWRKILYSLVPGGYLVKILLWIAKRLFLKMWLCIYPIWGEEDREGSSTEKPFVGLEIRFSPHNLRNDEWQLFLFLPKLHTILSGYFYVFQE